MRAFCDLGSALLAFGLSQPLAAQTVERTVGGVRLAWKEAS